MKVCLKCYQKFENDIKRHTFKLFGCLQTSGFIRAKVSSNCGLKLLVLMLYFLINIFFKQISIVLKFCRK